MKIGDGQERAHTRVSDSESCVTAPDWNGPPPMVALVEDPLLNQHTKRRCRHFRLPDKGWKTPVPSRKNESHRNNSGGNFTGPSAPDCGWMKARARC